MKIYFRKTHSGNYQPAQRGKKEIRYLVIHYTANNGDTAKNNADYFAQNVVSVSAHYFVDEREIWQSVPDGDIAWHCGTRGTYYHPSCRNANSIGIELCSRIRGGRYCFAEETVKRAAMLVRELMLHYDIPQQNVVRHYDVTHKNCPAPFVENTAAWQSFCQTIGKGEDDMTEAEVKRIIAQSKVVYRTAEDAPDWARPTVNKLLRKGLLRGGGTAEGLAARAGHQ